MPVRNIAKVFGPTIVGYSSAEPEQHAIFTETTIQASVMEKLLSIPADYWCRYLTIGNSMTTTTAATTTPATGRDQYAENVGGQYFGKCRWNDIPGERATFASGSTMLTFSSRSYGGDGDLYTGTPSFRKTRKNKFYATPPYSTITSKNVI